MDRESITTQLRIEKELLSNIAGSLRRTLDWAPADAGLARRLSTLRFVVQAFHRHLERLMAIHEYDGYMSYVTQNSPHLQPKVDELKRAHDGLQDDLLRITSQLERDPDEDPAAFEATCESLRTVLGTYEQHAQRETALLHEAFLRDEGGEG